jgi:hypothetical protein
MRRIEELILEIAEKQEKGFLSRDMKEFLDGRGFKRGDNSVSATLTDLHGAGFLFYLKTKENRFCRYFHHKYRDNFNPEERYDKPVPQTNWAKIAEELSDVLTSALVGTATKFQIIEILEKYNNMKDSQND